MKSYLKTRNKHPLNMNWSSPSLHLQHRMIQISHIPHYRYCLHMKYWVDYISMAWSHPHISHWRSTISAHWVVGEPHFLDFDQSEHKHLVVCCLNWGMCWSHILQVLAGRWNQCIEWVNIAELNNVPMVRETLMLWMNCYTYSMRAKGNSCTYTIYNLWLHHG